jgi:hypothetical protein
MLVSDIDQKIVHILESLCIPLIQDKIESGHDIGLITVLYNSDTGIVERTFKQEFDVEHLILCGLQDNEITILKNKLDHDTVDGGTVVKTFTKRVDDNILFVAGYVCNE